jgi:drug/metabolite transporter superfamily protein YnfA
MSATPQFSSIQVLKDYRYSILTAIIVATGGFLFVLWEFAQIRPLVVSIGLALASLFCAIPALTSTEFKGRWFAVVFGSLLVGIGTWYTSFELVHQKEALEGKLSGHVASLQRYVNFLPPEERPRVMITFSKIMREEYRQRHFDLVMQIDELLSYIFSDNGHLKYYEGEVWRQRKDYERMRYSFYGYLSLAGHRPAEDALGDAEVCYTRPDGFCGERTGWVCHLMAGDFYAQALSANSEPQKRVFVEEARKHLKCEGERFSTGFVQNEEERFPPTGVIRAGVDKLSRDLGLQR